jgi:WD40 repeat protein
VTFNIGTNTYDNDNLLTASDMNGGGGCCLQRSEQGTHMPFCALLPRIYVLFGSLVCLLAGGCRQDSVPNRGRLRPEDRKPSFTHRQPDAATPKQAGYVFSVTMSPDNKLLAWSATASPKQFAHVWDLERNVRCFRLPVPEDVQVIQVTFSPDGRTLAACSVEEGIRFWDTRTWKEQVLFRGLTKGTRRVTWSPDGKRLASTNLDSEIIEN